ncbi:MAG: FHA domain-containing protein [Rhodocyclaceae bacterium]|nr:FHA domain-containing protein [Rhodocyclaceae bacterium]MCL4758440.1 FHA domain-containing protein [Rhodocyclaceae bacterium]
MAKIVLSRDGKILDQRFLGEEPVRIGRDAECEMTVAEPGIAAQQARITTMVNDHILEDLEGASGMLVNGKPVKRHLLQNGDVVFLGAYRLKYLNTAATGRGLDRTLLLSADQVEEITELTSGGTFGLGLASTAAHAARDRFARARLRFIEGPHTGQEIEIERILHPLGQREISWAILNRRPSGCFVTHVGGSRGQVNGRPLGDSPVLLNEGDVVQVGEDKFVFHPR